MANASPTRLGQNLATGDATALFLKIFSGEVLSAFARENQMLGMTTVRTITSGKSSSFPVTGKISASYHTAGNEITGSTVKQTEKIINIDDMLISSSFVAEVDELRNHFDVRSIFSNEMGSALAKTVDRHLIQLVVKASQTASNISGDFNGGLEITDADANTNMTSLIESIFEGIQRLDENDVPSNERAIVVSPDIYYKLANVDKLVSRDFSANNGDFGRGSVVAIGGVPVIKSNTAKDGFTDQSSASTTGQNNTYTGDFQYHQAILFHKSAIGSVKLKDLTLESTYDARRMGTLMTARMMVGHNILRPESAVSIKTQ
tara:strand:- start:896 stop:1849 length:954 start_codon:yes stop_codon:yes gene_type:complete